MKTYVGQDGPKEIIKGYSAISFKADFVDLLPALYSPARVGWGE